MKRPPRFTVICGGRERCIRPLVGCSNRLVRKSSFLVRAKTERTWRACHLLLNVFREAGEPALSDLGPRLEAHKTVRSPVKSIFMYDSGEFLGSARVGSVKHKRLARGGAGPMRAGEILNPGDLKRLNLDHSTVIYVT